MKIKVFMADQKGAKLYIGVLSAKDLKKAKVDYWTPNTPDGYQRPLNEKRIGEGAWYLIEGEAIFPTSVLLSVRGEGAVFHEETSVDGITLGTLDVPDEQAVFVIDGQHRKEMLEEAIRRGERVLEDYQVPVTILLAPEKFEEMRAFYLVNSRAKSVPTDIADRLLQRAYRERGGVWLLEHESPSDKKAEKSLMQGRATMAVDYLRQHCPVWQSMIEVPGEEKPSRHAVRQHTIVSSLLEGPFKESTFTRLDDQAIGELLDRYWRALAQVFNEAFAEPENYSIRRTPGLYSLHMIFPDIFERCREMRDYSEEKIVEILRGMNLDSNFWHKDADVGDPKTFGTSMKSLRILAETLRALLPRLSLAGL
jgi:DGQHR domain-containing protein